VHSCGYFREKSCRFGVVRVLLGIPKRVTSLCFRALRGEIWRCCLGIFVDGILSFAVQQCLGEMYDDDQLNQPRSRSSSGRNQM